MSNYLEGIFHPAYSFDTISGFQTILNTSLEGNVTIGNLNTSYSLLLNGVPVVTSSNWSFYPALNNVMINGYDISGIVSLNGVDTTFNMNSNVIGLGNNAVVGNIGSNITAFGSNAASNNTGSNIIAIGANTAVNNSGNLIVTIGSDSGKNNTGDYNNFVGVLAGFNNSGNNVNTFGNAGALNNTGDYVNAIGEQSASNNTGDYVNALGYRTCVSNSGDNVIALGSYAGYFNSGSNSIFIGNNPNSNIVNSNDNTYITYSTNGSAPFLYGDLSMNKLSIGTSDLSANLTISGSLFATGSIYDSTYSVGASGQVLSSTATGVKWATIPGGNTANRVYVDRVNLGGSFNSVGGYGYPPFLTSPEFLLRSYSSAALSLLIQNWDSITVNVMLSVQTGNFDWCGIQWICDDYNNSILTSASVQTSFVPPAVGGPQNLVPISLTFVLIKGVHYTNSTTTLKLVGACTNGAAFWNTWDDGSTVHTSDLVTNFIGGY
jgi:hypothetical protein